jgi:serine-type D-Ala-D-Ala carboxypeptidase/endopeptidase
VLADMVMRGEVALEDSASQYLPPEMRLPSRNGKAITLLHLATDTSGLPALPQNLHPADNANPLADSNLGMVLLGQALAWRACC